MSHSSAERQRASNRHILRVGLLEIHWIGATVYASEWGSNANANANALARRSKGEANAKTKAKAKAK